MGFDISYHPIKETEIKAWYFDLLEKPELLTTLASANGIERPFSDQYEKTLEYGLQTPADATFERSHGYNIAIVQGFFRSYYYTRGSAFSFLIEQHPYFERYTKDLKTIIPENITNPVGNRILKNYSSGVFIPARQVLQLLVDYQQDQQVKADLDAFFSHQRIHIFLKALEVAEQYETGILEATEVIEPNPLNLNESICYTNLYHCDQEGVYLFKEAAIAQLQEIERQNKLSEEG